jgi:hypothetical protein
MQAWKCQSQAQRSAFMEEEKQRNQALIEQEMNIRYPGRDLKDAAHLHTFVTSSVDAWIMETTCSQRYGGYS